MNKTKKRIMSKRLRQKENVAIIPRHECSNVSVRSSFANNVTLHVTVAPLLYSSSQH